ncbi:IclR family transcriptional regulator [Cribrihabitans pelagius]|uniref:IclR family transcriptional regulator n=1 Tax=Cribrihabitans pelagius TaxID=1765746 RepID=UPI003B5B2D93
MAEAKGVEAVDRALQILECFTRDTPELALAEIAKATGFYKSTILRMAVSLEKFGYLVRGDSGRFRLGPAAWRLGSAYRQSFDLSEILRPELKLLSDATGETASYYVREGEARVCLYRSEPVRAIRHSITEGASMPLELGASGKVLRAFSGRAEEADAQIQAEGYAVSRGERDPEVAAVSVPVMTAQGRLLGALAVSGLITRFGDDRLPALAGALKDSQHRLAGKIGS